MSDAVTWLGLGDGLPESILTDAEKYLHWIPAFAGMTNRLALVLLVLLLTRLALDYLRPRRIRMKPFVEHPDVNGE